MSGSRTTNHSVGQSETILLIGAHNWAPTFTETGFACSGFEADPLPRIRDDSKHASVSNSAY
jgi:hypothetical protein